jgi:predicted dehydrogenase
VTGPLNAAFGTDAPSNRIRVATIGVNSRGRRLTDVFARLPGCEVAYVCDVDSRVMDRALALCTEAQGKAPRAESDFRRILEDPEVDAVVIASPDHWHAPMAIMAVEAGKHVYVEKPCSHTPREGELLVEAARKHGRVVQMGNQRRSWSMVQEAMALVQGGEIGRVHHARSWYTNGRTSIGRGKETAPPDSLDWDLWQGPAPRRAFHDNFVHYHWHWFWHWGTGEAGNNAIHSLDLARWGLGTGFPTRVTSSGGRYYFQDDWETPDTQMICCEFEGGKFATWEGFSCNRLGAMGSGFGTTFHGEGGSIQIDAGNSYRVYDEAGREVRRVAQEDEEEANRLAGPRFARDAVHAHDFLQAIREGKTPSSDIAEGHVSTVLQHLGNIAHRTGRALRCDPQNGHILNDPEAAALWTREYEPGWELET